MTTYNAMQIKEKLQTLAKAAEEYGTQAKQLEKETKEIEKCTTQLSALNNALNETAKKCDEYINAAKEHFDEVTVKELDDIINKAVQTLDEAKTNLNNTTTAFITETNKQIKECVEKLNDFQSKAQLKEENEKKLFKKICIIAGIAYAGLALLTIVGMIL
jgi:ABC-type transporter Mla subunit MlaD